MSHVNGQVLVSSSGHIPVLLREAIDGLQIQEGDIFVDATINGGGHSIEVAKRFGKKVKIVGIDLDQDSLEVASKNLEIIGADFLLVEDNFKNISQILLKFNLPKVNRILFDLGLSSRQFEISGRGFSFQKNEPLLMTFKKAPKGSDLSAYQIVNEWEEVNLAEIIFGYGEERYSRRIAKAIVEERLRHPIETTADLVKVIERAVPGSYRHGKTHFATRTFQALRIAVNDEIGSLRAGILAGFEALHLGGRMAVISFHSIEDRIVKRFFREKEKEDLATIITKKPLIPTSMEVTENRRSRSAKLRIIEKK